MKARTAETKSIPQETRSVSQTIRALREKLGWSKAKLAREAELHPTTVGLIESDRYRPYPGQVAKLARALGVRLRDLTGEDDGQDGQIDPAAKSNRASDHSRLDESTVG